MRRNDLLNYSFIVCFAVQITWTDGSGTAIAEGFETYVEAMEAESKRFTTKSILKIVPKMEHHNTSIWCQAHNSAVDKKLQTKIHLYVKFAPKVSTWPNRTFIIYFNIYIGRFAKPYSHHQHHNIYPRPLMSFNF